MASLVPKNCGSLVHFCLDSSGVYGIMVPIPI